MDAAMLAHQTEKLEALNASIIALAHAVETRPTREEIDRQASKNRLKAICSGLLVAGFGVALFLQQHTINTNQVRVEKALVDTCEDRNTNNREFIALLARVSKIGASDTPAGTKAGQEYAEAFGEYAAAIKQVNCQVYVKK
jgi:hypothetical protein